MNPKIEKLRKEREDNEAKITEYSARMSPVRSLAPYHPFMILVPPIRR